MSDKLTGGKPDMDKVRAFVRGKEEQALEAREFASAGDEIPGDFYEKNVTMFPYSELDRGGNLGRANRQDVAVALVTEVIQWLLGHLFHGEKGRNKEASVAYKRLLALVVILRPDLVDGKTPKELMAEIGEGHNALTRYTNELIYALGLEGINQRGLKKKLAHYLGHLHDFDKRKAGLPKTFEEYVGRLVEERVKKRMKGDGS